jgi:electron transfer flavoprotein alpha subunit
VCAAASRSGLAALGDAGADRVLLAAHPAFARYDAAGYAAAVAQAVERVKPAAVLFAASSIGRDLAPRVAARLGVGLAADCTALAVDGGALIATRPVYAGKAIQTVRSRSRRRSRRCAQGVRAVAGAGKRGAVEPLACEPPASRARVREVVTLGRQGRTSPSPRSSCRAGRGLKGPSTSS